MTTKKVSTHYKIEGTQEFLDAVEALNEASNVLKEAVVKYEEAVNKVNNIRIQVISE